jgi:hypothetical protein
VYKNDILRVLITLRELGISRKYSYYLELVQYEDLKQGWVGNRAGVVVRERKENPCS